jgi:mitochondrial fission protein ELM1
VRCVIVSDGKKGHVNQSIALAELLELPYTLVQITHLPGAYEPLSRILSHVLGPRNYPASLRRRVLDLCFGPESVELVKLEAPGVVISAGTTAAVPALVLARELGARTLHVLRPSLMLTRRFDALVLPLHDVPRRQPPNAVVLPLAFGPTSGGALQESQAELVRRLENGAGELRTRRQLAMLIGGDSLHHRIDPAGVLEYVDKSAVFAASRGLGILLTTSRRTPVALEENLQRLAAKEPGVFTLCVWGRSDSYNPVPAFLDAASAVLVTADSVSMVSECILAGHHPLIYPVEATSAAAKLERFSDYVYDRGFAVRLDPSSFSPIDWENALSAGRNSRAEVYNAIGLPRLAAELRRRLGIDLERPAEQPPARPEA